MNAILDTPPSEQHPVYPMQRLTLALLRRGRSPLPFLMSIPRVRRGGGQYVGTGWDQEQDHG